MNLILLNLQSNQHIKLNTEDPLIIGRGNVIGCSDKRVSRSHGKITCTLDGKINLIALHSNPCFYTRNGVPPVQQLNKDEEETLTEGDCIGLLPNAFWFQITTQKNAAAQPEINESCKVKSEAISDDDDDESEVISENYNSSCVKKEPNKEFNDNQASDQNSLNDAGPSNSLRKDSNTFRTPELEKTRRLPVWMYEIDEPDQKKPSPLKRNLFDSKESKIKKKKTTDSKKTSKPKPTETDNVEVKEEVILPDCPSTSKIPENSEISEAAGSSKESETKPVADSGGESSKQNQTKDGYESDVNEGSNTSQRTRPICQYEANCYRKNPQHKLDFCHPGDADYVPYENRPVCRYRSACYRQNSRHRVEYRHPSPGSSPLSSTSSLGGSSESLGEERPPCRKGSKCQNRSPGHRKDFYHPPKGYNCYFRNSNSSSGCSDSLLDWDSDWSDPNDYFDIDGHYGYGDLLDFY